MAEWWQDAPPSVSYDLHTFTDPYYPAPFAALSAQAPRDLFPPTIMPPPLPMPSLPMLPPAPMPSGSNTTAPQEDSPREIRNKAEKLRRDTLNQYIAQLASMVPPVIHSTKKVDKIGVLRYTAHYLRVHQYVFDKPPEPHNFSGPSAQAILSLLKGFLLTTTYKGLIVVVSQNIKDYLGYIELDLLGKSVFSIIHKDDQKLFRDQLMPWGMTMGQHGELLVPNDEEAKKYMQDRLANEKRLFHVRFLKVGNGTEPSKYVTCHVEGSFRISDRALTGHNRTWVRRTRARGENPCDSGNDVVRLLQLRTQKVFVGVVRPFTETFINESALEFYRLEYRTRHSIDGEIIQCEQRICLVTGYMMEEVHGVNAMNFIHRAEVRWVIIALKEMYSQNQVYGESCYRLVTKTGKFIYMRTRGRLDVDSSTRSVTSFLCTNTVVEEREGKQLIRMMKERYKPQAYSDGQPIIDESSDSQAVEDPRKLEKAILNMLTTLPPPEEDTGLDDGWCGSPRFCLITNKRERIVNAIEKIYTVFKKIPGSERSESPEHTPSHQDYQHLETNEVFTSITHHQHLETNEVFTSNTNYQHLETNEVFTSTTNYQRLETNDVFTSTTNPDEMPMMTPMYFIDNNDLSSHHMSFQEQAVPDAGYISEYSPVMYSDIGSASGSAMTNSHEEMMMTETLEVNNTVVELTYEIINDEDATPGPSTPSTSTAGVKRPNQSEDEENASKKKVAVVNEQETIDGAAALETFLNDPTLNALIQSAIDTLEEDTLEMNSSEFLSPSEVEDILDEAENEIQPNEPS